MKIQELIDRCYNLEVAKGWHDTERTPLEIAALFHSEISEFVEAARDGKPDVYFEENRSIQGVPKPAGASTEIVDLLIRIFAYWGYRKWEPVDLHDTDVSLTNVQSYESRFGFASPLEVATHMHREITVSFFEDVKTEDWLEGVVFLALMYFSYRGWNFKEIFDLKMRYNELRPQRHGGKKW